MDDEGLCLIGFSVSPSDDMRPCTLSATVSCDDGRQVTVSQRIPVRQHPLDLHVFPESGRALCIDRLDDVAARWL